MQLSVRTLSLAFIASALGCPDPAAKAPKANVGEAPAKPAAASKPTTAAPEPAAAATERLTFSEATSKIEFVGSKVTGKHEGGFAKFKGAIELDSAKLAASKLDVSIDLASTFSDNEKLTGHLKSPDFFDAEAHPTATFALTELTAAGDSHQLSGTLQIRGATKKISFPAKIDVSAAAVVASAEFSINRKDFNMVYPGKADDLIRDDVLIRLSIKAPRK